MIGSAAPSPVDGTGDLPVVSVVIPGRNVAPFVGDALCSLALQFDDAGVLEVIFIDDGSSDGSAEIVARHRDRLPGLTIMRNETAGGVSHARNQGLAVARGRYISFLDADDWFAPGHLASLVHDIERLGCDFLRTDVIKARGPKRELKRAPQGLRGVRLDPRGSILPYDRLTMVDHTWSQAGLYDRRLIDAGLLKFSEGLRTAEDRLWAWRLHLRADSFAVVDAPGFVYRQGTPDSLTQTLDSKILDYLLAFDSVRDLVEQDRERERFMPKLIQTVLAITEHHMDSLDRMPPELQHALPARARDLVLRFDPVEVAAVARMLSPERRARLHPILGDDPTSRRHR